MKAEGYRTGLSGKDHCFGRLLDRSFGWNRESGHGGFREPMDEEERAIGKARAGFMYSGRAVDPVPPEKNITRKLFDNGMGFIDEAAGAPWFLWLSIPDPHPPYMVCEPYASMYDDLTPPPYLGGQPLNRALIITI